jgi:hypothetical protein
MGVKQRNGIKRLSSYLKWIRGVSTNKIDSKRKYWTFSVRSAAQQY